MEADLSVFRYVCNRVRRFINSFSSYWIFSARTFVSLLGQRREVRHRSGLLDVPVDLTVIEHYPGHLGIRVTGQHNLNGLRSNLMRQREIGSPSSPASGNLISITPQDEFLE